MLAFQFSLPTEDYLCSFILDSWQSMKVSSVTVLTYLFCLSVKLCVYQCYTTGNYFNVVLFLYINVAMTANYNIR